MAIVHVLEYQGYEIIVHMDGHCDVAHIETMRTVDTVKEAEDVIDDLVAEHMDSVLSVVLR